MPGKGKKKLDEATEQSIAKMTDEFMAEHEAEINSADLNEKTSMHSVVVDKPMDTTSEPEQQSNFTLRPLNDIENARLQYEVQRSNSNGTAERIQAELNNARQVRRERGSVRSATRAASVKPPRRQSQGSIFYEMIKDTSKNNDKDALAKRKILRKLMLHSRRSPDISDLVKSHKPTMKWPLVRLREFYLQVRSGNYLDELTHGAFSAIQYGARGAELVEPWINTVLAAKNEDWAKLNIEGLSESIGDHEDDIKEPLAEYIIDNFEFSEPDPISRLLYIVGNVALKTQLDNTYRGVEPKRLKMIPK